MWFVKREMADCLTYWPTSCSGDDFCRSWNLCSDETTFTDDEGNEVTSLLDDLAEAKRHISTDDIDNDSDDDCVSLWDDVFDEHWTTKDSDSGPTLAELNGGELTDLEQYEPLRIATKRKRSQSSVAGVSHRSTTSLTNPAKICDVNKTVSALQTAEPTSVVAERSMNLIIEHPDNKEKLMLFEEQQDVKGTLSSSKPNRKVYQKFVHDVQLTQVSLPFEVKEDLRNVCGNTDTSANHSQQILPISTKHSRSLDTSTSAYDFCASKRLKMNHGGRYLLNKFTVGTMICQTLVTISFKGKGIYISPLL